MITAIEAKSINAISNKEINSTLLSVEEKIRDACKRDETCINFACPIRLNQEILMPIIIKHGFSCVILNSNGLDYIKISW